MLSDNETASFIDGLAFHWYTDFGWYIGFPVSSQVYIDLHNKYPDKFIMTTEGCFLQFPQENEGTTIREGVWHHSEFYAQDIIDVRLQHYRNLIVLLFSLIIKYYWPRIKILISKNGGRRRVRRGFSMETEGVDKALNASFQGLTHWETGFIDNGLALNMSRGPYGPPGLNPELYAGFPVDAPIIVNNEGTEFYKQPSFYVLGHFR